MPLFKIENQKVKRIHSREFHSEREIQNLIDANLEDIFGIRLVSSFYNIPNEQIDALGIDERNVPIVVEYKWKQDDKAIIQGLSYLGWVKENRKHFELLVSDKLGKSIKVRWDSPRLIIIAKDFTPRDMVAIKQMKPTVELKRYSFYDDLISIEDLTALKPSKASEETEAAEAVEEDYTIEKLLQKANPELRELFLALRDRILAIGEDVWERVGQWYCDYRKSSTFASPNIQIQKNRLLVYIKMGEKEIDDPKHLTEKKDFSFGKLNTRFELKSLDELDYAMHLIQQAYEYVP